MAGQQVKWDSGDYRANSSAQAKWAMEMIAGIGLKEYSTVLDIGCGDGRITREIARLAPKGRVVGIDASENMIALARESFANVENLRFVRMDARAIDLPERFDIAFSNAALHWIKEQDAFLAGLHEVMVPGGMLHFNFGGRGNAGAVFETLLDCVRSSEWSAYFPPESLLPANFPWFFAGDDEYRDLLKSNGFEPDCVRLVPKDMVQAGREGFAGWIRTTWMPFTNRVPENIRERFIAWIVDCYVASFPPLADGGVVVKMVRLEAHAKSV